MRKKDETLFVVFILVFLGIYFSVTSEGRLFHYRLLLSGMTRLVH